MRTSVAMILALRVKRVGNHPARHSSCDICSAHGNYRDLREATTDDGEKLETGHLGHVEVGNNYHRKHPLELQESIKAACGGSDIVSCRHQYGGKACPNGRFV